MIQNAVGLYQTKSSIQKNTFIKCIAFKNNIVPNFSLCKTSPDLTFHHNYCGNYAGLKKNAQPRSCKFFYGGTGGNLNEDYSPRGSYQLGGIALKN